MKEFKSLGEFEITGRGKVFLVECDETVDRDYNNLLNSVVKIDDIEYEIRGVESHTRATIQKGQKIGLLVKEIENN